MAVVGFDAIQDVATTTKTLSKLVLGFKAARRAATPIIGIRTPDPYATMKDINSGIADETPKMRFDIAAGFTPLNEKAAQFLDDNPELREVQTEMGMVMKLPMMPAKMIVYFMMADRFIAGDCPDSKLVIQGLCNIRDQFKANRRTVVLLVQNEMYPPELQNDIVSFDEELPDDNSLRMVVNNIAKNARIEVSEETVNKAIEAIQGLPNFPAEQVTSMSITTEGKLDLDSLWERKRKQIEQTPGLSINREGLKFDDIGGLDAAKLFLRRYFEGKRRPRAVVFIDEIEKAMAGEGDLTGISQDQLGETLKYMQNTHSPGLLFVGHPGGGKSVLAKAVGNEYGVPTIELDYNGFKDGIVGSSEANIRKAFKVIQAVSSGNALFIATSNNISQLKPELKRRYKLGTYMFDLMSEEEQRPIWDIHMKSRGLEGEIPPSKGWTGAEIETCCEFADILGISLAEAAKEIVPLCVSDNDRIVSLQEQAHSRYKCASKGGVYRKPVRDLDQHTGERIFSYEE